MHPQERYTAHTYGGYALINDNLKVSQSSSPCTSAPIEDKRGLYIRYRTLEGARKAAKKLNRGTK